MCTGSLVKTVSSDIVTARTHQESQRVGQSSGMKSTETRLAFLTLPQLMFHATAAEALSTAQGEMEELAVAAEGEYR
jgi:hypothetical protein